MSIETMLFDQDYVTEMYLHEIYEESYKKGFKEGYKIGTKQLLNKLVKQGLLTKEEAKKQLEYAKIRLKEIK